MIQNLTTKIAKNGGYPSDPQFFGPFAPPEPVLRALPPAPPALRRLRLGAALRASVEAPEKNCHFGGEK